MAHHDALAVAGEHEHVALHGRGPLTLLIEGVEVDGGAAGKFLWLALAQPLTRGPLDRRHGIIEGASGSLDSRQPAQPVRMTLGRQVQQRVGGVQVGGAARAVGTTLDLQFTEDAGQPPLVPGLNGAAAHAVGIDDRLDPSLAVGPQVQMILQEPAQQLATLDLEPLLELCVRHRGGLITLQPADQRLKPSARPVKATRSGSRRRHRHDRRPQRPCRSSCQSRTTTIDA